MTAAARLRETERVHNFGLGRLVDAVTADKVIEVDDFVGINAFADFDTFNLLLVEAVLVGQHHTAREALNRNYHSLCSLCSLCNYIILKMCLSSFSESIKNQ